MSNIAPSSTEIKQQTIFLELCKSQNTSTTGGGPRMNWDETPKKSFYTMNYRFNKQ